MCDACTQGFTLGYDRSPFWGYRKNRIRFRG